MSLVLALLGAAGCLYLLGVSARGAQPIADFSSPFTTPGLLSGWHSVAYILLHNMEVLAALGLLFWVTIRDRSRSTRTVLVDTAISTAMALLFLGIIGFKLLPAVRSTADGNGFDPVQLMQHLLHGPLEFGAFLLPSAACWVSLLMRGQLPNRVEAVDLLARAAMLLVVAAACEVFLTPLALPAV